MIPFLTADLPGIGGTLKVELEDFEVEEIPAYEPCGEGEHLYLWIEKRDMSAEYFERQIAKRLDISTSDIGMAGLKDRRAVTRQWVSVPVSVEERLSDLEGEGISLFDKSLHTNKLRSGHLRGNRFRILIRDAVENALEIATPIVDRLREQGVPNFYGPQRFGNDGETGVQGLALLRKETLPDSEGKKIMRNKFLRKLVLSAGQSYVFNEYLARRMSDGLLHKVLPGDVMAKWPVGGMFVAEDVEAEQARVDAREIVSAGPMIGRKTFAANGEAEERERALMEELGIQREVFTQYGKLLAGTRRQNWIYVDDLNVEQEAGGLRCTFTLPSGSYATVMLNELMKVE